MDRKIKLKDISVLNNIISKKQPANIRDIIWEHQKKSMINQSYQNEFRPGSEEYIKIEEQRAEILALPDHDIKYCGDVEIIRDRYGKTILDLTLGVYTVDEHHHDYDGDSYMETVQYFFLVKNRFWCNSIYTKFTDIFTEYHNILSEMTEDNKDTMFYDLIKENNERYSKYFYLLDKEIKKALSHGYNVMITQDRNHHGFGKEYLKIDNLKDSERYYLETLDKILEIEYYWYNDRKTRFGGSYHFNSVMEEYEYAKDNICVEENS